MLSDRPGLRRALSILFPLLAGTLALWLLEASKVSEAIPVRDVPGAEPTRVVVFWIDSLAREEAENPKLMPRMHARIAREGALHGPVRACADAVSVPCFTAMITGVDRFSVFALGRNFGGQKGALDGSVLRALQDRKKRLGYLGVPMFKDVLDGLEVKIIEPNAPDIPTIDRGIDVMDREKLDFVIVHMHETDDYAHRLGPSSSTYREALTKLDAAIDRAFSRLKPTDHVMIMGDHGHTEDGRHFAGLDVPTFAAFFGPLTHRTYQRPMAISDYGTIWARLFGVQFGERSWVEEYFEGKTPKAPSELPSLPTGAPTPVWAALLCATLAALVALTKTARGVLARQGVRGLLSLMLLFAIPAMLGATWMQIRPFISFMPLWKCVLMICVTALIGASVLAPAAATYLKDLALPRFTLSFLGVLLLAVPTVYKYGGAFAAMTWLGAGIVMLGIRALRRGERTRGVWILTLLIPLYTIYNPAVRNFSVRWFPVYSEWFPKYAVFVCVGFMFAAWLVKPERAEPDPKPFALWAGLGLAAMRGVAPDWVFAIPCALAAPLCVAALRRPQLTLSAVGMSIPALWFFAEGDAIALGPVPAVLVLWAGVPRIFRNEAPLLRALVLLSMLWITFWASMGCRITGVTFNFFFAWLPPDVPVTRTWAPHALYTLSKYVLPPLLGLVLAARTVGPGLFQSRALVGDLILTRLGLVIAFMSAFSFRSPDAGPFITADIVQEAALWMILLGVSAVLPRFAVDMAPAGAQPTPSSAE